MSDALIAVSMLPHPDSQVWQIVLPQSSSGDGSSIPDEIERMIENGED